MKWQKAIRKQNEPYVLEQVFICRKFGQYAKVTYLGYGVYDTGNETITYDSENPVCEWMSITLPKRLR